VAEIDGHVRAVISFDVQPLFHQDGNIGTIMALCVSEGFRGRGIGRALIQEVELIALNMGCTKIAVASGIQRLDTHRFYRSLGYEENSKRFVKNFGQFDSSS
jgi:GNAT superfamily N-acetyltransferase